MAPIIERHLDVRGYFHERVEEACEVLEATPAQELRHYLVELLGRFKDAAAAQVLVRPLALQMASAEEQQGPERFQSYRTLGDAALFLCGFCPERFERAGLKLQYAIDMGGTAYARTGDLARRGPHLIGDGAHVYDQLAGAFEALVRILGDVRQQTVLRSEADVLSLYERWWESRSPRLAQRLAQHGVTPQVLGDGPLN
jgi:hypothetical protein